MGAMPGATLVNNLRLVGTAGTNKVMAGELSRLAKRATLADRLGKPRKEGPGNLVYPFDTDVAALAVRYHRTCVRVLWDLFQTRAPRLEPLYEDLLSLMKEESRDWLARQFSISVSARGMREFAAGERQVVGTVKNAIVEGARTQGRAVTVDPDEPDVYVSVRMVEDVVTVSIDLAGRPMNQRGYRVSGGPAPLRENLAAVLVMLGRHDARKEVLFDPMAGTGTIAVEAACMADARTLWIPPREPACAGLRPFRRIFAQPAEPLFADTAAFVIANELSPEAHRLSKRHVGRSRVESVVQCRQGDFRAIDPDEVRQACRERGMDPDRGLILSNPPYGERIGDPDLSRLYRELGQWCRRFRGWRAGFLVVNREFEEAFGQEPRIRKPLSNGPLRGYFLLYDL
jgi:23S rRNA G2445 N2-methylase RlmL